MWSQIQMLGYMPALFLDMSLRCVVGTWEHKKIHDV